MPVPVADRSSNKNEQLVHAAEVIGRSAHRAAVFKAIYTGKKRSKSVTELMTITHLKRNRVLDAALTLANNDLITARRTGRETHYEKVAFFQKYRDKILGMATDRKKRAAVRTKRSGPARANATVAVGVRLPKKALKAVRLTVDEVDSFAAVQQVDRPEASEKIPESRFRDGMAALLGEKGHFADWGGELRDLASTRLRLHGQRRLTAFAFKGPATTGKLTPRKMGKNGDQIQRLFKCPAEVFVVQYQGEVDDSVYEQLQTFAQLRSYFHEGPVYWMVIDGVDSRRLIEAYPSRFS